MTRVAEAFANFLGLPLTPPGIKVLDGRKLSPSDVLGSTHYPLKCLAVRGRAVAVSGSDATSLSRWCSCRTFWGSENPCQIFSVSWGGIGFVVPSWCAWTMLVCWWCGHQGTWSSQPAPLLATGLAVQSWVNREYRRELSTHPWGAPVFRIKGSPECSCRGRCLVPRHG